jgi:hypothetical protein
MDVALDWGRFGCRTLLVIETNREGIGVPFVAERRYWMDEEAC